MIVDYDKVIDKFKSYSIKFDEKIVRKALKFAVKYHGDQKRASGDPYYIHPIEVAEIIAKMRLDTSSIITALLHDTIEDTELTYEDIKREFSLEIAKMVDGVTKLNKIKFKVEKTRQAENFRKLLLAMSEDIRVLLVKLADRLHNMRTIDHIKKSDKRKKIAIETMEIYAPLAERIGIQQIKVELQEICFRILHPDIRESIIDRFEAIDRDGIIDKINLEIKSTLKENGLKAEVSGRRKTPYSAWMKMKQKNITLDQLSDIVAFRILVNNISECYRVLGIIHNEYKMVPSSFQDFISTPKNNDYQSLHTLVIGPLKQKIEIQIRTRQMHEIAELGVAAHWRYKQDHYDPIDGKKYNWIRELLNILEHNDDPDEFLQNTKLAMYYDQVFCFTPEGNLIALPKGASAIDFAYTVDANIGNHCSGVKINGRIAPLKTLLENGDQIEIITTSQVTASLEWEKIAITGKALSEIRKIIRNQREDEYIKLGANIINKALKGVGINNTQEVIEEAAKKYDKTTDSLLKSIGEGIITREEIIKQLQLKKSKLSSTLSLFRFSKKSKQPEDTTSNLVPIHGLVSGIAMHYAKCCHPLPGDRIVGVIHTGSGITIHTSDCSNLVNYSSIPERIIDLTWNSDAKKIPFISRISMVLINEVSSLATVSAVIAGEGGSITNFKILSRNLDYFEMIFDIEVESLDHIEKIINSLRTKNVVQKAERVKL